MLKSKAPNDASAMKPMARPLAVIDRNACPPVRALVLFERDSGASTHLLTARRMPLTKEAST